MGTSESGGASVAERGAVEEIWFTRCPVPTATGIAADLGWLSDELGAAGITVSSLQDQPAGPFSAQHFEHGLPTLFREGGNVPALWTRSRGQATRLIGLTWIDERQAIVVRPGSGIADATALSGRRLALPDRGSSTVDFFRAMALHGFAGALRSVGLDLEDGLLLDVRPPEGFSAPGSRARSAGWPPEIDALASGVVDAVYIKAGAAIEAARAGGNDAAIELDSLGDRRFRVNNGTPRPITVHESLLEERPDLVVRFLAVLLRAAEWRPDTSRSCGHPAAGDRSWSGRCGGGLPTSTPGLRTDPSRRREPSPPRSEADASARSRPAEQEHRSP